MVPAKRVLKFRVAKVAKDAVLGSKKVSGDVTKVELQFDEGEVES